MRLWIFKLSFRYLFPKHRWGTFFTWCSIFGIAAGVVLLCVVLSIMSGFDENISTKLIQVNGPIKILSNTTIADYESLANKIKAIPQVKGVTPFIQGIALIQNHHNIAFPKCLGVDHDTVNDVIPLKSFLVEKKSSSLLNGAIVSTSLTQELKLKTGKIFNLYSPLALEAINNDEIILPQEIKVIGTFRTGWAEVDRNTIIFPIEILQEAYGMKGLVHGFCVNANKDDIPTVCKALNKSLPDSMHAYAWNEINKDFLYILRMEKTMCFFVLLFVVIIAAFSISSGLMFSVVRKQREISLLRTWGASRKEIITLFCLQSVFLSFMGITLGIISSLIILDHRNDIVNFLTGWFLPQNALWNFYDFEQLPAAYCLSDFMSVVIFTFIITLLASFFPALKATYTPIVRGLQRE